jgi:plasmid maintenance system antidote protein VapI
MLPITTKLYKNDWNYEPVRPWEIIEETLEYHKIGVADLAKALEFTDDQMSQLMQGDIPTKDKVADTLARLFKNSPETWERLEDGYQQHKVIFAENNKRRGLARFLGGLFSTYIPKITVRQ